MKKRILLIIILLTCLIFLFSYFFANYRATRLSDINAPMNHLPINRLETTGTINNLLESSYYMGKDKDIFSSTALSKDGPEIYNLYWILKITSKVNYPISQEEINDLKNNSVPKLKESNNYSELQYINMISWIYSFLSLKIEDNILEKINKHYDTKSQLYFNNDVNETLKEKLLATSIVIEISKNLKIELPHKEQIVKSVIEQYMNDNLFTKASPQDNLLNNGGTVITTLSSLGITPKQFSEEVNQRRMEWLSYWNNKSEIYQTDWFSVSYINQLLEINRFFSSNFPILEQYLDNIFTKEGSFNSFGFSNGQYNIEPHYLYEIICISTATNYDFPYFEELNNFIEISFRSSFKRWSLPPLSPREIYYGLILSKYINFKIRDEFITKQLDHIYTKLVDENSSIKDIKELMQVYYLILSYYELNKDISKKDLLTNSIDQFLRSTITTTNINNRLLSMKVALEIHQMLNVKTTRNINNLIKSQINILKDEESTYNTINMVYLIDIIELMNLRENYPEVIGKILDSLSNLSDNGGFRSRTEKGGESDILSTYDAVRKLVMYKKISPITENIKLFMDKIKDKDVLYKLSINSSKEQTDLQVIYYGLMLDHYFLPNATNPN